MGCGASKDGAAAPAAENKQKEQAPPAAAAPAPAAAERKEEAAAAPAPAAADPAPAAAEPAPAAAPAPAAEAEAAAAPKLKRKPEASRAAKPAPAMVAEKPAAERRWADAKALLPRKKTAEDKAKRQDMWKALDTNGNGMVSLAEFDKYAREVLKLDDFTNNLSPILIRAFNAAKAVDTGAVAENSDDFVTFAEFRLLLVNLAAFFELMEAFDEIDTSDDRRVSVDEFKAGLAKLKSWGVVVADPDSEFRKIDKDGAGMILFAEFASWGMDRRLDVDGDPDDEVVA